MKELVKVSTKPAKQPCTTCQKMRERMRAMLSFRMQQSAKVLPKKATK